MTQEEKAKAYDEALERAKKMMDSKRKVVVEKQALETIFPELAESEDERIRRWLCDYFSSIDKAWIHKDITCIDILRWLEKQKEQKPAEWSEEDEKKMIFLERLIEHNVPDGQYGWVDGRKGGFVTKSEAISMLKSLRPRYHGDVTMTEAYKMGLEAGKASSWKPSEEQMEAFKKYIEEFHARAEAAVGGWNNFDVMIRLYEQLKKL